MNNSAMSESAENSTMVLELQHQLHLAKAQRSRAEESEASARDSHAHELLKSERLEKTNQSLAGQVHILTLEAASARANAAKEKSMLLERVSLAEDSMMGWKQQFEELKAQLDQSGRLRLLQDRISSIEQRVL
jgi:hypothetical protein